MYKIMFPNEVEIRKRMFRRKKGHFLVPGPNYQWCIDGHDKLKAYGFEIYAAIDAYSRNIIWFYVGHSATTALSVLKQYLAACDTYGFRPWYLQADRGSETPLIAAAHWNFALAADGRVEWNGKVFQQGKRLKDSYKAAPSTKNVKIESWWERMLHVSSRQWVDYFGELARDGDFDGDMLEDQIAIYAVFEDILRQELFDFVEAWNIHRIRLQKNRPHVVHGQPWMNYHYPDPEKACNWGIPINRSVLEDCTDHWLISTLAVVWSHRQRIGVAKFSSKWATMTSSMGLTRSQTNCGLSSDSTWAFEIESFSTSKVADSLHWHIAKRQQGALPNM
ncbi:hypothetical protein BGZ61DRAFT_194016 [Ilyonectria robusta]|uniref:uncharacterized protein n=1 Tax=Ilyonectria robusta TaxID=1079257 RepID=UPI001E8D9A82|nr:uncharacterized protein BGZ61DRAFT_194016 [Ilyonectria robusta]KAH8654704.1 hypothetical protein BGZ61DRAFT_194016 [Ilyonectria robusta]